MADVYLIGNAHLDPVWLWRWKDGFSEVMCTFRSALDRMKEFPDFKFTSACSVYYELIEKIDPEMFEEIKERVKEGRWSIVGGWVLQPDCNMPDGESFARHALIGQRFFKEKLGVTANTGYNVDSFGHSAGLPKILKASGMDNYVFMRPFPEEQGRDETVFNWESDDGSSVKAYRIPIRYGMVETEEILTVDEMAKKNGMPMMAFYGVGNHGGGPTIKLIEDIIKLDIDKKFATVDEYFELFNGKVLPVINGELQHHARGCYGACGYVKNANRRAEQALIAAEKLCVMANKLAGYKYPKKKLKKAWKNVLFNQFHDIIGGCSIKPAYDDAAHLYGEAMSVAEQEIYYATQKIAWSIDTLKGETLPSRLERTWKNWEHEVLGTPVVVFNPHTWATKAFVAVNEKATKVTDEDGNEIPFQIIRGNQTNGDWDKTHTAFYVDVPAYGYATYRIFTKKESEKTFENEFAVTENTIENAKIKVELDPFTGDICKIYDKEKEEYILDHKCRAVLLDETDCDTWAHNKDSLGEVVGMFVDAKLSILETGPSRAVIRSVSRYNDSVLTRDFIVYAGDERVTVKTKVDFHEKHKTLKFTFPMTEETTLVKTAYSVIERKGYTGEEPCLSFIANGKVAVANDNKYGYDTENGEVRMTVARGAIYADHYGQRDDFCEYMDQGVQELSYSVFRHKSVTDTERKASELNFAPTHVMGSFHKGHLPENMSCFESGSDNVMVSCIKQSEDNEDAVIRVYETEGKDTKAEITLFGKKLGCDITHCAIKTLKEDGTETNILEMKNK